MWEGRSAVQRRVWQDVCSSLFCVASFCASRRSDCVCFSGMTADFSFMFKHLRSDDIRSLLPSRCFYYNPFENMVHRRKNTSFLPLVVI